PHRNRLAPSWLAVAESAGHAVADMARVSAPDLGPLSAARPDVRFKGAAMNRAARWRLAALSVVCTTLLVVLAVRLWYVQVASGNGYLSLASQERARTVVLPPDRGQILDDTGRPLVGSRPSLVVTVNRTALSRQSDGGRLELHRLAALLGVN